MTKSPPGQGNPKRLRSKSGLLTPRSGQCAGDEQATGSPSKERAQAVASSNVGAPAEPTSIDPLDTDEEIQHFRAAFRSIEVSVSLENTFTRTMVNEPGKVKLIELGERDLILEVPARSGATGHLVAIVATIEGAAGGTWTFDATAKITELEHLEDDIDRVNAHLIQYEEPSWQRLLKTFGERQNEIEQFMQAARGY